MRLLDTPKQSVGRAKFLHWFLMVALTFGVLQLYVLPFLPLAIWWILAAAPFVMITKGANRFPRFSPLIVAIVLSQLCSAAWSPDFLQAIRSAATAFGLLVVFVAAWELTTSDPVRLRRVLSASGAVVSMHAVLIGVFFLLPEVEAGYLRSPIAPLFSGQGVTRIYTDLFNNVVLEGKAGGFFVNGNTASMFMGVCATLFFASALKFRSKWHMTVAALSYTSAIMTGSKTALFIGIGWVGVCLLLQAAARKAHLLVPGAMLGVLAVQAGLALILEKSPELARDSSHTFGSRQLMWDVAIDGLSDSPILGLGFGGWFNQYEKFGSEIGFSVRPAHNLILQTWLDSGVVAVLVLFAFYGAVVWVCLRLLRLGWKTNPGIACSLLAMTGWIFIHGQGDNTTFYGDTHALAFFAVGLALLAHSTAEADAEGTGRERQKILVPRAGRASYNSRSATSSGRSGREIGSVGNRLVAPDSETP